MLPTLYGEVVIPPAVYEELRHPNAPSRAWAANPPDWLRIVSPSRIVSSLRLVRGECEAISLAVELKADVILMDERRGRNVARRHAIAVAGTLDVLLDAATAGTIDLDDAIARLSGTTFYMTDELIDQLRLELRCRREGKSR